MLRIVDPALFPDPPLSARRRLRRRNIQSGSALLIVLTFLILLTGIVALFLGRALIERDVADSSMNQTRASILASSALDVIVSDLKQEIALDSTAVTVGKVKVYEPVYPATATIPSPMSPIRTTNILVNPNLIRISTASAYPATLTSLGIPNRASNVNSTSSVSANTRFVSLARWNAHYLNPRTPALVGTATIDSTPDPNYFTAPDWVLVTPSGPQPLTWSTSLSNPSSPDFVVGRYAYAIYDEGGLIDANVAGYPSNTTTTQIGEKGSLALADLTQALTNTTQPGVDQLVGWRNYATAQPSGSLSGGYIFSTTAASNYYYYVAPPTNSPPTFLTINPTTAGSTHTDQTFTSRQALIRYQRATYQQPSAGDGFGQDDLQYLGTFTRALNVPAFYPRATPNAALVAAATVTPMSYANTTANSTNPPPEEVPVNLSSSTSNGQPLITERFPLSRLALFENPSSSSNQALIKTYFGLTYESNHRFSYGEPGGVGVMEVMTLAQVAASNPPRQPDFFEMLQAAVLSGSLYNYLGSANSFISGKSGSIIMHLGANIINQYMPNNYPIVIDYGLSGSNPVSTITGTDDLPYFSQMLMWPYRPNLTDPTRSELDGYLVFQLWNPHQQPSTAVPGPAQIRLIDIPAAVGSENDKVACDNSTIILNGIQPTGPLAVTLTNAPAYYREPTILNATNVVSDPNNSSSWQFLTNSANTETRLGLQVVQDELAEDKGYAALIGPPNPALTNYFSMTYAGTSDWIQLQALGDDGVWYPYQGECTPNNSGVGNGNGTYPTCFHPTVAGSAPADQSGSDVAAQYYTNFDYFGGIAMQSPDPRCIVLPGPVSGGYYTNETVRPSPSAAGLQAVNFFPDDPVGYVNKGTYPGMYNENSTTNAFIVQNSLPAADNTYMYDGDGVLRPGDGYLGSSPYIAEQTAARPIILHRPFRSVAEMGYAYRGITAWKTVNFFNSNSGDAGLLDYFSLENAPMVAGKLNLNTLQPRTLQSALMGAYRTEATSDYLTSGDASNIASAIVTHNVTAATGSLPQLASQADLVRSLLADTNVTTAIDNIKGTTGDTTPDPIKMRREAVIRALTDVSTARTWNLLIDVIAQSGHYVPNATQLSQFVVTGEKHYWLHVALDRYTGNIIDQQLEEVNE